MVFALFGKRKPAVQQPSQSPPDPEIAPLTPEELKSRLKEVQSLYDADNKEAARDLLMELSYSNPDELKVLIWLGVTHALLGEYAAARDTLIPVLERAPEDPDALKFLSLSYQKLGELTLAAQLVDRAIALSPNDAELMRLGGDIATDAGNFDAAAQFFNRALEIVPESEADLARLEVIGQVMETRVACFESSPKIAQQRLRVVNRMFAERRKKGLDAYRTSVLLALLSGTPATFPRALELARELLDSETLSTAPDTNLHNQMQRVFMMAGDAARSLQVCELDAEYFPGDLDRKFHIATAWISYGEDRWVAGWRTISEIITIYRPYNHNHGVPIWEGQALGKRKLLVYQDQGVGDAILGFRFLPHLAKRGIRFELWVQPPLADLAEQIPGCQKVHRSKGVPRKDAHGCDFAITFFGLVAALYLRPDEIKDPPSIRPPAGHALELRRRVRDLPGLRVGLLYGGNPRRRDDWLRSVPAQAITRLASLQGVSWVNLMVDDRPDKAQVFEAFQALDPMPEVTSFCDTAALVEELDAVVAVDASVAHVAGNLRKPMWVLAPPFRDWRWQIGETPSPWWPTATLLRCDGLGVWDKAVERLLEDLAKFLREAAGVAA